jgi:hypothetical protein
MSKIKTFKRVNYFIIFVGFSLVLVLQTWLSVLNAQQAYLMSEARADESKILRVLDRMEEFSNYFNSSEYLYAKSYESNIIVLTPKENILESDIQPATWNKSPNLDETFISKEEELDEFLTIYSKILPEKDKKYFTPLNETLSSNPLGQPIVFIENSISYVLSGLEGLGSGFKVENVFSEKEEKISETVIEVTNKEKFDNSEPAIEEEQGVYDLLPAPDTH